MTKHVPLQFKNKVENHSFSTKKNFPDQNRIPAMNSNLDHIVFRCADTLDDYIKAFRLLHDVFVQSGYIEPTPSALRITPYHGDPNCKVFLGMCQIERQEIPLYTISVFPDSEKGKGLPMDQAFKKELDILRSEGRKIVEVGALASDPRHRKHDMIIPMYGNKMVIRYAMDYLMADDIVITVHPKYQWVYEEIIFFKKIGQLSQYAYVKNNPAVAMRLDLRKIEENFRLVYGNMPKEKNLYNFFFKESSPCIMFPKKTSLSSPMILNSLLLYYLYFRNDVTL